MPYRVNGVEIIGANTSIEWSKLSGAPVAATVTEVRLGTISNCGTYFKVVVTATPNTTTGNWNLRLASQQATPSNCNCNCDCTVNCTE